MRLFIVTTGWLLLLLQKGEGAGMGPWVGLVNEVTTCSGENQDRLPTLLVKINKNGKYGRTVVKGSFNAINSGLTNDSEMVVRVLEFKKGRWVMVLTRNMGAACNAIYQFIPKSMKLFLDQTADIETYTDGNVTCVKPSKGEMKVPFDFPPITLDSIPTFIYGAYRVELILQHPNQTVFGCSAIYGEAVAKGTTSG